MSFALRLCGPLIVVALLMLTACGQAPPPPGPDVASGPESAPAPSRENWDVRFQISQDGHPRLDIVAPYMAYFDLPDSTYTVVGADPEAPGGRVTVYVYDGDSLAATVLADRLIHPDDADHYVLTGAVVVTTPTGRRLESDDLTWFEAERKVRTSGFVRIETPTENIQGYNLEADEDLTNYTLRRITGQIEITE